MLRHEVTASVLRFYQNESAGYFDQHDAILMATWLTPKIVFLWGATGKHTRRTFRQLLAWLRESGIETVLAERSAARTLPMGKPGPLGMTTIDVRELLERLAPRASSDRETSHEPP